MFHCFQQQTPPRDTRPIQLDRETTCVEIQNVTLITDTVQPQPFRSQSAESPPLIRESHHSICFKQNRLLSTNNYLVKTPPSDVTSAPHVATSARWQRAPRCGGFGDTARKKLSSCFLRNSEHHNWDYRAYDEDPDHRISPGQRAYSLHGYVTEMWLSD